MAVRKLFATLLAAGTLTAATVFGFTGPASAAAQAPRAALTSAQVQHAVSPEAVTPDAVTPKLTCSYYYVCGQAANGNSFAYTRCNVLYELPNLVGSGPLINNQTPGTVAYFYDKNGYYLFSSTAYQSTTVNWTPVWYAIAC